MDQSKYVKLNRTITNKVKELSYYANPNDLKAGQYFVDDSSMCCAVKLHEKKEKGLVILNTQNIKECYDERVVMVMYVKRDEKYNNMTIRPYYYHLKTSLDLSSVAVSIVSGGYVNAVYQLVSGKTVSVNKEYSGIEWAVTYNYNTYK